MEIKQFVFNPFGVNCYILSNSKGEAILIDPSVSNAREQAALTDYLKSENLKVVRVLNTHLHLDHVLGNAFAERTFGIKAEAHKDDTFLLDAQKEQSQMFGLPCNDLAPALGNYLNDGDIAMVTPEKIDLRNINKMPVEREIARIDWDAGSAEKGKYAHFMSDVGSNQVYYFKNSFLPSTI